MEIEVLDWSTSSKKSYVKPMTKVGLKEVLELDNERRVLFQNIAVFFYMIYKNMGAEVLDWSTSSKKSYVKPKTQIKLKEVLDLNKERRCLLQNIAQGFFGNNFLSNYCWKGRKECTDWSNLYILTKEWLVKVWCWEFNSDTFINWVYSHYKKQYIQRYNFNKSPFPLYVVNQDDSYFAYWKLKELMDKDPKSYLERYSVLKFNPNAEGWKKTSSYRWKWHAHEEKLFQIDDGDILSIDDTILAFRNACLDGFDKKIVAEYMKYLQSLTIEELTDYARNSDNIENPIHEEIWRTIYNNLWWVLSWSAIYAKEAIESRKKIIDSYDVKQQRFTYLPEFKK